RTQWCRTGAANHYPARVLQQVNAPSSPMTAHSPKLAIRALTNLLQSLFAPEVLSNTSWEVSITFLASGVGSKQVVLGSRAFPRRVFVLPTLRSVRDASERHLCLARAFSFSAR